MPPLIDRELGSPAFVRDLRSFLRLSEETLSAIAEIGDQTDGFVGIDQAKQLQNRADIPTDEAMAHLRIADHLYRRTAQLDLDVSVAVEQIVSIASEINDPVEVDDARKHAISLILSFKRGLEVARATAIALADGPHFMSANAHWNVKLVKIRNGEVVKAPFVGLTIVWLDSAENANEMFVQMSESDWEEFTSNILDFNNDRQGISEYL